MSSSNQPLNLLQKSLEVAIEKLGKEVTAAAIAGDMPRLGVLSKALANLGLDLKKSKGVKLGKADKYALPASFSKAKAAKPKFKSPTTLAKSFPKAGKLRTGKTKLFDEPHLSKQQIRAALVASLGDIKIAKKDALTFPINGMITFHVKMTIDPDNKKKKEIRRIRIRYDGTLGGAVDHISNAIDEYVVTMPVADDYLNVTGIDNVRYGAFSKMGIDAIRSMRLEDVQPLKLRALGGFIDNNIPTEGTLCVENYLLKAYKKIKPQAIKELSDNATIITIKAFCEEYSISMRAYDINFKLLDKFDKPAHARSYRALMYVAHSGHMYVLTPPPQANLDAFAKRAKKIYQKLWANANEVKVVDGHELNAEILKIAGNGEEVDNVLKGANKGELLGMVHDKTIFICNQDYHECETILGLFGLGAKLSPFTRLSNVYKKIESLYAFDKDDKKVRLDSFNPYLDNVTKTAFNYARYVPASEEANKGVKYESIDANKAYSSALQQLPFLLVCDIKRNAIAVHKVDNDGFEGSIHSLYHLDPIKSGILFNERSVYSGLHLYESMRLRFPDQQPERHGSKYFQIPYRLFSKVFVVESEITEFQCSSVDNVLSQMVTDIFERCDPNIGKQVVNRAIGRFQLPFSYETSTYEFEKLCNKAEKELSTGFATTIGRDYYAIFNEVDCEEFHLQNRKPIAIQIQDRHRRNVFEKIRELNIKEEDVLVVNTDSVTFRVRDTDKSSKFQWKLHPDALGGWKRQKVVIPKEDRPVNPKDITPVLSMDHIRTHIHPDNIIYDCYGGAGKTTAVLRALGGDETSVLYDLLKDEDDILVISPHGKPLVDYKRWNKNAGGLAFAQTGRTLDVQVCDHFLVFGCSAIREMPPQNTIIIDEHGLQSPKHWDFVYKLALSGKKIICLGDFKQLLAVGENRPLNRWSFLNLIFPNKGEMSENWRNHFTKKFYDDTIAGYLTTKILEKYTVKWEDAQMIICYENSTCADYNKKRMDLLQFDSIKRLGCKIICSTTGRSQSCVRSLRRLGVYNRYMGSVVGYRATTTEEPGIVVVRAKEDDTDLYDILVPEALFDASFMPGYATTVYGIQGDSLESFHYAVEDYKWLKSGRVAYTVISRLKNDRTATCEVLRIEPAIASRSKIYLKSDKKDMDDFLDDLADCDEEYGTTADFGFEG